MMRNILTILLTLAIPFLLFAGVWQTGRYTALDTEIQQLNKKQYEIVAENKRLVSGITALSTPERIEKVATTTLGMRKAHPDEIMRIELKKEDIGG